MPCTIDMARNYNFYQMLPRPIHHVFIPGFFVGFTASFTEFNPCPDQHLHWKLKRLRLEASKLVGCCQKCHRLPPKTVSCRCSWTTIAFILDPPAGSLAPVTNHQKVHLLYCSTSSITSNVNILNQLHQPSSTSSTSSPQLHHTIPTIVTKRLSSVQNPSLIPLYWLV